MPIYEYKCLECGHKFEELIGKSLPDSSPVCPKCDSDKCEKQFSSFAMSTGSGKSSSAPPCATGGGCPSSSSGFS